MVEKAKEKLSMFIKLSYGLSDVGFMLMISLSNYYLMFFFTDLIGFSAALAGTVMMAGRIVDAIMAPIVGVMVEKSNYKWGKYRSWLLLAPIPILIFNGLMFMNLNIGEVPKAILAFVIYAVFCVSTSVVYCGYTSLNSTLTTVNSERVALSTFRGQGAAIGKILAGFTLFPLIGIFGGGTQGFFWTAVVTGLFLVLCYFVLFGTTKNKAYFAEYTKKEDKVKISEMIKQVLVNKPLLLLIFTDVGRILNILITFGMLPYFFKYCVQDMSKLPVFFGIVNILMFGGATLVPFISKKLSKRDTYRLGNLILAICLIMMSVYKTNIDLVIVFASIGYIGYAFGNVMNMAMYADTVEYGEWKTGKNARGFIFSMYLFAVKLAAICSTSIIGFGLASIGYVANTEPTQQVINGINNITILLPAGLMILGVILLSFYKLDDKMLVNIRKEIAERKTK